MIRIVVPGPPPRKNDRAIVRGRHITSKRTREWGKAYDQALFAAIMAKPPERLAKRGRWCLRLDVYEQRQRKMDVVVPLGDVDSCVTAVLDAMQKGKWAVLDDDVRVIAMTVVKHYDKSNPRVEITMTEVTGG